MCRRSNQRFAPIYLFLPTRNNESSYNFPVILIFCKQRFNQAHWISSNSILSYTKGIQCWKRIHPPRENHTHFKVNKNFDNLTSIPKISFRNCTVNFEIISNYAYFYIYIFNFIVICWTFWTAWKSIFVLCSFNALSIKKTTTVSVWITYLFLAWKGKYF